MGEDGLELDPQRLDEFIDHYLAVESQAKQPSGVFSILSGRRERKYQQTLQYFLDPNKPHGFGTTLLDKFLETVDAPVQHPGSQHIEIEEEVYVADDGSESRIDLIICGGQALADHPEWAVFLELKVGADENQNQTPTYANTKRWQFTWFDNTEITVSDLDEYTYAYIAKFNADPPEDDRFNEVSWEDLADAFEECLDGSLFQYPTRSVIQFTDFINSLQETENMPKPFDEDELSDRLKLYFEYDDVIDQVEQAQRQFETDFDDLSTHLTTHWQDTIQEHFPLEDSGWIIRDADSAKWQGFRPTYWEQNPRDDGGTLELYYHLPPTTETLRNRQLAFHLRLPPQRKLHKRTYEADHSFNNVFTEKASTDYEAKIRGALEEIDDVEIRLGSASTLFTKTYELDPENLVESYLDNATTAVEEFCTDNTELVSLMNTVFEESYEDVFEEAPVGDFSEALSEQN
ncbi:PD-(D/E)XK nuclease family protein [Halorubellus salinus]|uniref:PD-(D/E)XK nuclease family protein n=1 Tax=Halorubellus salinus TaxID=755309 RepID=UPI001D07C3D9|nr:PD-(D/E)XK nuclease family protein [Halorubellus salinus]